MELDSTPTRARTTTTTKLLLGPLSFARGQKKSGFRERRAVKIRLLQSYEVL